MSRSLRRIFCRRGSFEASSSPRGAFVPEHLAHARVLLWGSALIMDREEKLATAPQGCLLAASWVARAFALTCRADIERELKFGLSATKRRVEPYRARLGVVIYRPKDSTNPKTLFFEPKSRAEAASPGSDLSRALENYLLQE